MPLPGPVIGMALLFALMILRDRYAGLARGPLRDKAVEGTAKGMLAHLSLLFVPVGVGVMTHLGLLNQYGLRMGVVFLAGQDFEFRRLIQDHIGLEVAEGQRDRLAEVTIRRVADQSGSGMSLRANNHRLHLNQTTVWPESPFGYEADVFRTSAQGWWRRRYVAGRCSIGSIMSMSTSTLAA